jgi:hypothetical protein
VKTGRLTASAVLSLTVAACSASPIYTRTHTTLGEVDLTGLECRKDTPINTNVPRTVCASPEAWAAYQKEEAERAERVREEADRYTNVNQFGRPR